MKNVVLSIFLFLPFALLGQVTLENAPKKAVKAYNKGYESIKKNKPYEAIEHLKDAIDTEPEFVDAYLRLGEIYYYLQENANAKKYLREGIERYPEYDAKAYYLLGELELITGNFEEAKELLETYQELPNASPRKMEDVQRMVQQSVLALESKAKGIDFKPKNLGEGVNSHHHEYQPVLTADEQLMFFTRRMEMEEDFYTSEKENDKWGKAQALGPPVSTEEYREGSISISPDGNTIFFAANYSDRARDNWNIYSSQWDGEEWLEPESLGDLINTEYYESQPSISATGKELYFISRRPGGKGGNDIWMSYLQEDCTWSEPVNLGKNINTSQSEQVPYIHADGQTLYFGSTGHPGLGASDLFVSRRNEDGSWGKAENLGFPVNTPRDEGSLFVTTDGSRAYYASDMEGGLGGLDLYTFQLWEEIRPQPVTYVKTVVRHSETDEPLAAEFELIDLETGETIASSRCQEFLRNNFLLTLPAGHDFALNVSRTGFLFHSENFSLPEKKDYEPEVLEIALKPIKVGETVVLKNIFFETGRYELQDASQAELDKLIQLMEATPALEIEVSGHTDNVGTATDNQELSQQRAKSVYDYLVENGIEASRLAYKGYGQENPIAPNDTAEGRAKNRRTEFKVVAK